MKKFLFSLLNSTDPNSSKRFAGLIVLTTTVGLAIFATFKSKGICPEFMFDSLLMFGAGCFGFNMVESIFKKKNDTTSIDTPTNTTTPDVPSEDSTS